MQVCSVFNSSAKFLFLLFRSSFPTDDPEWEEMKKQKAREGHRKEDLELLHNSMFG